MLNENIKAIRRSKGLSQQELAVKVNVVRQTVSKWEQGLSVPDSDLLIALSEALETPVSTLLGETVAESEADEIKALSEKLEIINLQFARRKAMRRSVLHWLLVAVCVGILAVAGVLAAVNSPYLGWDYSAPETAVMGVVLHAFEWGFVRLAPFVLTGAGGGLLLTLKKPYHRGRGLGAGRRSCVLLYPVDHGVPQEAGAALPSIRQQRSSTGDFFFYSTNRLLDRLACRFDHI